MKQKTLLASAIAAALMLQTWAVSAQDATPVQGSDAGTPAAAKKLETITVTGSRIRSVDVETAQPVFTMTQQDIQKTGLTTAGDILNHLTVASATTFGKGSVLASDAEQGGQYVNMRHLGEQRVLVLVNGKRWATANNGFTDVSNIPSALIERVEVLKDGASSVYGSDAISGVINFILKDHYNGAEVNGYLGQNQGGDGTTKNYSFTVGNTTEKSSIVFNANYNKQDAVWANSRGWTRYGAGPQHETEALSSTGPWGRYTDPTDGSSWVLNHTGNYNGVGTGADSRNPANYHAGLQTDDRYNPTQQMMLRIPSELKSVFSQARYNLTDNLIFHATGMYSERDSSSQIAGYPLTSDAQPNYPVYVDKDSYYNPLPGNDLSFARRIVEMPRVSQNNAKTFHFDTGLEGYFEVGEHEWNWDAGVNYNKLDGTITSTGNINLIALKNALGPSFLNADGVVQCGTAANPIALGTSLSGGQCTPFNILGGPSASTANALKYIGTLGQATYGNTSKTYSANITGGLFNMPLDAGEFAFAAGFEHRDESGYDRPGQFEQSGYSSDLAAAPTEGSYQTNEFYLEFNVPVLKDLPFAKELSFDVASRYSHYSNFGSTTNNKYSFKWKPIDDLLVRGTFAKGFRAPTIGDLAGGGSQSFDTYTDPCDTKFGVAATNPTVAARCQAAGVPANFRQQDKAGGPNTNAGGTQGTVPFNAGVGNRDLQPEYATTRTLGLVYSPSQVEGLDVSLDWYKVKVTNVITSIDAQFVMDQCVVQNVASWCNNFTRDSTGQINSLNRGNANLGAIQTEGYDFGMHYRLPQYSFGKFVVSLDGTYLKSYDQQSAAGARYDTYAGTWSYPRVKANLGLDWSLGDFGATWGMRYQGAFRDACWDAAAGIECNQPNYTSPTWGTIGANRKGAIVFNDVQARWNAPWNASFSVGVNNVFNRRPPVTYSVTNGDASAYDPALDLTRYFYVSYNQKF
jgi:iron complex outermembrane receptor protein